MYKKATPVLIVDAIEPVLPLWDALGFQRLVELNHDEQLGFVILSGGNIELMYQSVASVRADEPHVFEGQRAIGAASVYIEVERLDDVAARLPAGTDIIVERRTTFYGATELILRDAAGNVISFAEMSASA